MFVDREYAKSREYQEFWENLRAGRFQAAQFIRIGKDGENRTIEASYNPILDVQGKPFKVTKFAIDLTPRRKRKS